MTAVEIILLLVGVVFMIGSFFVTEKLSQKEITQISEMSSTEMRRILEKNMEQATTRMKDLAEEVVDLSLEDTKRWMERETNVKIQNISEYSESVLEAIHKNHGEVMFLYGMLNDKQVDLKKMVGRLEQLRTELERMEEQVTVTVAESAEAFRAMQEHKLSPLPVVTAASIKAAQPEDVLTSEDVDQLEEELEHIGNQNQDILMLYRQKVSAVEIARRLGLGVGEVKLVIDLYRGERS